MGTEVRSAGKAATAAQALNVRFRADNVSRQFDLSRFITMRTEVDYLPLGFSSGLFSANLAEIAGENGFEQ